MQLLDKNLLRLLEDTAIPDAAITQGGVVSDQFYNRRIPTFYAAIDYIYKLPYAPPSDPFNYNLVLVEGKGTCSTRHALLTSLANELHLPVQLGLAIYNLTPERFPDLADTLNKYGIPYIPESHNFLIYNNQYLDITFPGECKILLPVDLINVEAILPDQITSYKAKVHAEYLHKWFTQNMFEFNMNQFNLAHRACIKILGDMFTYKT